MMKLRSILVFSFLIVLFHPLLSQSARNTLNGYIEDSTSGERLIGANLYDPSSGNSAVSNEYGFFSIRLKEQSKKLDISYLGYGALEYLIPEQKEKSVIIKLVPQQQAIDEVVITAHHNPVKSHSIGIDKISMQSINKIPVLIP